MYVFVTLQVTVASKCYIKKIIKHVVWYVAQRDSSNSVSFKIDLIKIWVTFSYKNTIALNQFFKSLTTFEN